MAIDRISSHIKIDIEGGGRLAVDVAADRCCAGSGDRAGNHREVLQVVGARVHVLHAAVVGGDAITVDIDAEADIGMNRVAADTDTRRRTTDDDTAFVVEGDQVAFAGTRAADDVARTCIPETKAAFVTGGVDLAIAEVERAGDVRADVVALNRGRGGAVLDQHGGAFVAGDDVAGCAPYCRRWSCW